MDFVQAQAVLFKNICFHVRQRHAEFEEGEGTGVLQTCFILKPGYFKNRK